MAQSACLAVLKNGAERDTTKSDITLNHMLLFQSGDPKVSTEEWKILKPPYIRMKALSTYI